MLRIGRLRRRICWSASLISLVGLIAATAAYSASKPVISGLAATPASVPSGGAITVSAAVSEATECILSSNKPVAGLPVSFSCESGSVSREVLMPENTGKKAAKYKLALLAVGAGGNAKAKIGIPVGTATAVSVTAGDHDSCAVLTTGRIKCWGDNREGQLGDGKESGVKDAPVEVQGITSALDVSTSGTQACAVLASGHVECWGGNAEGQLGDGTRTNKPTPVEVHGISEATKVAAGFVATCALLASGHVECWGRDNSGQLGNGTSGGSSDIPVEVEGIADAIQLGGRGTTQCATRSSGAVACWGGNGIGGLGIGSTDGFSNVPVEVYGITTAIQVENFVEHTCALLVTAQIECWGANQEGDLGTGSLTGPEKCLNVACSTIPTQVQGVTGATQVTAGREHTCALLSSGHIECWGGNSSGQLGDGSSEGLTPVEVAGITDATHVDAGLDHTCALRASGHIQCWGDGAFGQLGGGSTSESRTPVDVVGI